MSRLIAAAKDFGWPRLTALAAIAAICVWRIAPHPANLTPVGAMFVLGGLYLGRSLRWMLVPLAALLLSDLVLDLRWDGSLFDPGRLVDYLGFALVGLMALWASGKGLGAKAGAVVATPFVFFLVSNFGVWATNIAWAHSPTTVAPCASHGLAACYLAGLPFFRGTLYGDWLFGAAGLLAVELPRWLGARSAAPARA